MDPLIIVSCDGHVGGPVEEYREYLDPKYHDLMPELIADEKLLQGLEEMFVNIVPDRLDYVDDRKRIQTGGLSSGYDVERRLEELDVEGIAAEVIFPGTTTGMTPFFYQFNRPYPNDARMAGARAYHRWAAEHMIKRSKGRLICVAEPGPSENMDEALEEIRVCAQEGFRGVYVPGFVRNPALPPLFDAHFEPFWAACNDMELVLHIHAGWNNKQGEFTKLLEAVGETQELVRKGIAEGGNNSERMEAAFMEVMMMADDQNPDSILSMDIKPRQAIWQMIFGGVFDRYPKLKLAVSECRADWIPEYRVHLDQRFENAANRPKLKRKPSEYFGENVFIAPSSPRIIEVEQRHQIGLDSFLFAADMPHPEGTWPNTLTWIQKVFNNVPENEVRAILGGNAIKAYGLDEAWLAGIAAKIGPKPSDIFGDHEIDERVIADFDLRSGFSKTTPPLDRSLLDSNLDSDIASTAA